MTAEVRITYDGPLATVTLCQSARFNAMSVAMWRQLRAGFEAIHHNAALRCVLVHGEGGHFCAGGDIAEYPGFRFDAARLRDFHENTVWGALQAMLDCDLPLLAQIEGNCMGAGLEIASCCDIRIAGASARFGAPIARLGFPMAPRELDLVLRAVGAGVTREVLLEARVLDAQRLLQLGFLSRCVPDAVVGSTVRAAIHQVVSLAPQAARSHKRMLRALLAKPSLPSDAGRAASSGPTPRRDRLEDLVENAYLYADTPEHREGIAAFLDKRKPDF